MGEISHTPLRDPSYEDERAGNRYSIVVFSLGMGLMLALLYFGQSLSSSSSPSESEFPDSNNPSTSASPPIEAAGDSWRMRTVSMNGTNPQSVWNGGYTLTLNSTEIRGSICNGFAGTIEYVDGLTIKVEMVAFTQMLCTSTPGIMEVEELFIEGLRHGMEITETDDELELRDIVTNTTFVYGRDS